MNDRLAYRLAIGLVVALLCKVAAPDGAVAAEPEFRAAWVATVANIDWPSRPGLPVDEQQAELRALLATAERLNLNAIILQVRPACDALYASQLEPWSEFLTGQMGQSPEPIYDPLELAVAEAHARGLELHAWFNPYRARHTSSKSDVAENHISRTQPDVVKQYGNYLWLDPGEEAAADHSIRVMLDVVRRYDIDGVHMDDYFYPYPITEDGSQVPFPDDASYTRYVESTEAAGDEAMSRDDWRRNNVDRFVERLYREVKAEKPWVQLGISPFGIWRPGHPEQIKGFDQYSQIYADARKWFREGWCDYFTPQLYWPIDQKAQSYPVLLEWWHEQNVKGRHLWPGNYTSRVGRGEGRGWKADEIIRQIEATRAQQGASGNVHFSMKALSKNYGGVADALVEGPYREPAPIPASPWLADRPDKPSP